MFDHKWKRELLEVLRGIKGELKDVAELLRHRLPQHARFGELIFLGAEMPATILVGKTATAVLTEFTGPNGTGTQVPPIGPVVYSSDNPAVATVDPASGLCTGVSGGTANITGTDQGNGIVASDVLTVQAAAPPPAVSGVLTLTPNP